ncbi:MAG: MoxR family ATPase [Dehalococcoidia bacterium]
MAEPREIAEKVLVNVERVIIGKREEVTLALIALMCHGHVLIDDVPGVGKTMLARSIAGSVGCSFKRIQFTPDLLPSDITGVSIYNQKSGEFEFRPGPVMAQVVLADEINRATPKTQSALLECMEERQITVDGVSYEMPRPFLVMATQNPIEYEGTFTLPEAQLDRFMLRISLGYPSAAHEISIVESQQYAHPIEKLSPVTSPEEIVTLQEAVKGIYVDRLIKRYIVAIVEATRNYPNIFLGASPRGSLALFRASQARAMLKERDFVLPDDIKTLAEPVLAHRLIMSMGNRSRDVTGKTAIEKVLESVPVPGIKVRD